MTAAEGYREKPIRTSLLLPKRTRDELRLSSLVVVLTDQCHFDCAYCYQPKGGERLEFSVLVKAVHALRPFMDPECFVHFYGGEPLLAFDTLKRAVDYLEALATERTPKIRYSLTTNGMLLNEDILGFLDDHRFFLTLSFDGLAQDLQRRKGTYHILTSAIPRILAKPGISLETNSVFSPETVGCLSTSVQSIIKLGVRKLDVNFAHKPPWTASSILRLKKEISSVGEFFLSRYEHLADIPWPDFYRELDPGIHQCSAGLNQMALSARGTLWGCALFPHVVANGNRTADYERFCFGDVDSFIKDPQRLYEQKIVHYASLRMDRFAASNRSCLICRDVEQCWICPLMAALTTGEIGRIPGWSCLRARVLRKEKRLFLDRFKERPQRLQAGS